MPMDPVSRQLLKACPNAPEVIGTLSWEGTNDVNVTISPAIASASSSGTNYEQTYSSVLPEPDQTGYYFEVFLDTGTNVLFGLSRSTDPVSYGSTYAYTGIAVNGSVYGRSPGSISTPLTTYKVKTRLVVRKNGSNDELFFVQPGRFEAGSQAGPFSLPLFPSGGLRLIVMRTASDTFSLAIGENRSIFKGGGGLF